MMKQLRPWRRHPRDAGHARHGWRQEGPPAAAAAQEVQVAATPPSGRPRSGRRPRRRPASSRRRRRRSAAARGAGDGGIPADLDPDQLPAGLREVPRQVSAGRRRCTRCSVGTAGPRIAFLHGLFGQGRNWSQIAKALAGPDGTGARCTLVDLPDHGRSPWSQEFSFEAYAAAVADTLRGIDAETPWVRRRALARRQDRHAARAAAPRAGGAAGRRRHRAQELRQPRAVQRLHRGDAAAAARRADQPRRRRGAVRGAGRRGQGVPAAEPAPRR